MVVDGKAAHNVIAWDSFSIGKDAAVNFTGQHDYLNYVTGKSLSEIYGTMSGGNRVYLINPNGVIFGEGANINVGSLYASTRQLTDADINQFNSTGILNSTIPTTGDVVNRMEKDLGNMDITLEGDTVTFAKSVYENGAVTLGKGGQYTVHATGLDIGYDVDRESDEYAAYEASLAERGNYSLTTPTLPANTPITNLSAGAPVPIYMMLIGNDDLPNLLRCGRYMLSEDVTGSMGNVVDGSSFYFGGSLDGAGHTATLSDNKPFINWHEGVHGDGFIRNLTLKGCIVSDEREAGALATTISDDAARITIANVFNEADITVAGDFTFSSDVYVGSLAHWISGVTIKNTANKGNIFVKTNHIGTENNQAWTFVGGIGGGVDNLTLINVYNEGNVTFDTSSTGGVVGYVGGLFASSQDISITNSYNIGNIRGTVSGGLVALDEDWSEELNNPSRYTNVFNSGTIYGLEFAGGLIGEIASNPAVNNAYNSGNITGGDKVGDLWGGTILDTFTREELEAYGLADFVLTPNLTRAYNTGTINGTPAYTYYDANGTKHDVGAAADISAAETFSNSAWRTYSGQAPLLSSLLPKVYLPEMDGYGANGAEYLVYAYGHPSHLMGTVETYGNILVLTNQTYSDQLGYDLHYDTPNLTFAGGDDGYSVILTSLMVDKIPSGASGGLTQEGVEEYNKANTEIPKNGYDSYAETYEMEKLDVARYNSTKAGMDIKNNIQQGGITEEAMSRMLTNENSNDSQIGNTENKSSNTNGNDEDDKDSQDESSGANK